ncbi:MAG: hypothetical protein HYZ58_01560 [Acidobacteria bacterium]|nr:hypothetical protein [Acidobacteriota bacterium]
MAKKDVTNQKQAFEFLRERFRTQQPFTKLDLQRVTSWDLDTINTLSTLIGPSSSNRSSSLYLRFSRVASSRLLTIGLEELKDHFDVGIGESDEVFLSRVIDWIGEQFGGYSITTLIRQNAGLCALW